MHIGNMGEMREFKQQQLSKVEKRKKEDEKIRKGVSQMHSMIQSSCMETLDEETKKSRERVSERVTNENKGESGEKPGKDKKTDGKAEMEKMMAMGLRNASRILEGKLRGLCYIAFCEKQTRVESVLSVF